jgi:hypothetical protein
MQQDMNPLEDELGDRFVNHDKELKSFWQWAMRVPLSVPNNSHALIGRRPTGKTSILIKLYNRLFHEQDRVVPIFVSFAKYLKRPEPQISWGEFAEVYLTDYLRSYLAFRYRRPDFLTGPLQLDDLRPFITQTQDELALKLLDRYDQTLARPKFSVTGLADWIVNAPRAEARYRNMPTVIIIIEALMDSASPARERYPDLAALDEVVAFEISDVNGKLRQHNYEEFEKYSHLLNSGLLTRKVMFWVTKYPDRLIDTEQIAAELGESVENVQASLKKLHQIDVISPVTLSRYNGPRDPMLRRYIEYHHYIEIEKLSPAEALKDWRAEYRQLQGRLNHFVGEVGEVYLYGVMQRFDGRTVEGATYFNQSGPLVLPQFSKLERRSGIVKEGAPVEIDILGETSATPSTLWII